jgi:tetratricopeptide (TPR) repeat protein
LFVKAKIDLADTKLDDAVQALRSAIDVRPDWAEAHFLLGTALRLTGQRSAARTELARALEIDASLIEARRVLAEVHADLGEHEYAVEEGHRYLQQKPDAYDTRVRVAQSLVILGRLDEALREVDQIPEEARDENVDFALGRIYTAKGENEKARTLLLAALEKRPGHPDILRALLHIEERMGKTDEALARIQKAVAEKPDDAKLQQLNAIVSLSQGKVDEATKSLEKAIELAPDDMTTYQQLADLYVRTGRTSQTIETYEKALERKPDQPRVHHFLGVLYEYGGKPELAVSHYEEAIKLQPDLAESKNNLAYLYAESGKNLDRALDLAQDAKALMPDDPNTADTLGWVLYRRGVPSAAIGYLKEAEAGVKAEDATLGIIRHHLAQAYEASGDKENARVMLDRAIEAHEGFVEAQKARGVPVGADPAWYTDARSMRARL